MKDKLYIQLYVPAGLDPTSVKRAMPVLQRMLDEIAENEEAMRGYCDAAHKDGWPVEVAFATKDQLQELCVRAFWYAFEKVAWRKSR